MRETQRQTDRQRKTERNRDRHTHNMYTYIYIERERERQRQTETETDRQKDRTTKTQKCRDTKPYILGQKHRDIDMHTKKHMFKKHSSFSVFVCCHPPTHCLRTFYFPLKCTLFFCIGFKMKSYQTRFSKRNPTESCLIGFYINNDAKNKSEHLRGICLRWKLEEMMFSLCL